MANAKLFVDLVKRSGHSGYDKIVMNNHMFMQCYDIGIDGDVGMHYALIIPEDGLYDDPFYDEMVIFNPVDVAVAYNTGHKKLLEKKREVKAKPKEVLEEVILKKNEIRFMFYVQDELIDTERCTVQYPVDEVSLTVENILNTLDTMMSRIKLGGACFIYDCKRMGLQELVLGSPGIYLYTIKYNKKKIKVPLIKSMFCGNNNADKFYMSVQETVIPDIYLYTLNLMKKNVSEIYYGYVVS